jgi:hypothetical protein
MLLGLAAVTFTAILRPATDLYTSVARDVPTD